MASGGPIPKLVGAMVAQAMSDGCDRLQVVFRAEENDLPGFAHFGPVAQRVTYFQPPPERFTVYYRRDGNWFEALNGPEELGVRIRRFLHRTEEEGYDEMRKLFWTQMMMPARIGFVWKTPRVVMVSLFDISEVHP